MSEESRPPQQPSLPQALRSVSRYLDIGFIFAATSAGGALGGYWADARFGTEPWLLLLGAFLGIGTGFYHFLVTVLRK